MLNINTKNTVRYIISTILISFLVGSTFQVAFADTQTCTNLAIGKLQDRVNVFESDLEKFTIQITMAAQEVVLHTKNALSNLHNDLDSYCNNLATDFAECQQLDAKNNTYDASGNIISIDVSHEGTASSTAACQEKARFLNQREEIIAQEVLYRIIFQQKTYFMTKRLELFVSKFQTFLTFFQQEILTTLSKGVQTIHELVKDPL